MSAAAPDEPARSDARLLRALSDATAEACRGAGRVALLFSGGLDSSLLAWLVPPGVPALLVAVGVEGATDLGAANDAAARTRGRVDPHILTLEDVLAGEERWRSELSDLREPARSVTMAFALATAAAPAGPVLCGQGADELFYGYAHFRGLSDADARRRAAEDLRSLDGTDWPREVRIGRSMGRDLRAPYLDPRVREAAARFGPPGPQDPPKVALRRAAALAGLPRVLVDRPKRALQYGSGVARLVERMVRARSSPDP
jgi:asparagine synthase (glutamine-hydrolysing)